MKIKLQIKNRWTGSVIFELETENNTMRQTVEAYIKEELLKGKYRANLTDADLIRANLTSADLTRANLIRANLIDANLTDANLTRANLTCANLTSANLTFAKNDMFLVLLHAIPEISFLKKNIIEGKIDGSTYDGDCACLSGTLVNSCFLNKNNTKSEVLESIISVRDSGRPIEKFFLAIKPGDTPENNAASKIALEWINEFETLLTRASI